jgi:hypothetical protein
MIDRLLGLAGDDPDQPYRSKLDAFRIFVLLHGAGRSWLWLALTDELDPTWLAASAVALTACLGASLIPRLSTWALRAALPVLLVQLAWTFPLTDNHFYLEVLCVVLLALRDARGNDADERLVMQGLQWLAVVVLFHTGLQKVLYGHYFQGDFLAFMVGVGDRFADPFRLVLPAEEVARLQSYDPLRVGAGPYRVDSVAFLVASSTVWLLELLLPMPLIVRRTRMLAACCAIAFVLTLQLGARELGFAFLFSNLLLLFPSGDWNRRLLPVFAVVYLYALGAAVGLLPGGSMLEAGYL